MNLFGVSIEGGDWTRIQRLLREHPSAWIVTANPEILLHAYDDTTYKEVVRQADWRTADGTGLVLLARAQGERIARFPGIDLAEQLLHESASQGLRVALFGGGAGIADEAVRVWQARLPTLRMRAWSGGHVDDAGEEDEITRTDREAMLAWKPDVLLVAFGGNTKQERWIARSREMFRDIRVIVGVGGTFDVWAGRFARAPRLFRFLGLEWMWRFFLQPSRFYRMWRATAVFVWRVAWH